MPRNNTVGQGDILGGARLHLLTPSPVLTSLRTDGRERINRRAPIDRSTKPALGGKPFPLLPPIPGVGWGRGVYQGGAREEESDRVDRRMPSSPCLLKGNSPQRRTDSSIPKGRASARPGRYPPSPVPKAL